MKDKNFLSSNFSSLKHCTNKNENLAFRQLKFSHCFPASSEGLHQLFFNSLSFLGLNRISRHLCTSLSNVVLNTAEFSFLLLLTSSPVVLNVRSYACPRAKTTLNLCWSSTRLENGTHSYSVALHWTVKAQCFQLRGLIVKEDLWKRW